MPKKKYTKPDTRTGEDIDTAQPGEYCYYLNRSNKPVFAEIKKVMTENDVLVFQLIDQIDYKFVHVPSSVCAFDVKELKGKKWAELYHRGVKK